MPMGYVCPSFWCVSIMGGFDVFGMGLLLFVRSIVVMVMAGFYGCRMGNGIDSHAFFFSICRFGESKA